MIQIVAIIPARLASSRFPRKVLADRTGKPLIQHVWEQAKQAKLPTSVVIAADDPQVQDAAHRFGATCLLTRVDHLNGTSRLAEAAAMLSLSDDDLVVNVQGDEPELQPQVIDAAVKALQTSGAHVATIASPFSPDENPDDPNIVKVVLSTAGLALYFSRSRIPFQREGAAMLVPPLKHIGLYAYSVGFLKQYSVMQPTPLEQSEMLEQLRVLESGARIAVATLPVHSKGVDTPEQYEAFVQRVQSRRGPSSIRSNAHD